MHGSINLGYNVIFDETIKIYRIRNVIIFIDSIYNYHKSI